MSFGKRQFVNNFADLPLDIRGDLIRMFPLVGLWASALNLAGGIPAQSLKQNILRQTINRNIYKFSSRPLIHDLLVAVEASTWPLPLPEALTFEHAQTTLSACLTLCDPIDMGAMRIILIDLVEQIEQVSKSVLPPRSDPFLSPTRPFGDMMRGATRALFQLNDPDGQNPDQPSAAIRNLARAIGAQDLLLQVPNVPDLRPSAAVSS